jgi:hypothetical protein
MNYRLRHNVELVERDGESFLMSKTPLCAAALFIPGFWAWFLPLSAFVCAARVDYAIRKPHLSFIVFSGIYLLEQIAYGAGVFWGCLSRKCFSSYRVVILRQMEQPG